MPQRGVDTCKFCGSDELWGNFFDADGFGASSDGSLENGKVTAPWDLLCQRCGKFQKRRNTARNTGRVQHNDGDEE